MRTRIVPAVAGLALALVLALTATSGAGAGDSDNESPDPTAVIAANAGQAPITVPLVEDTIPARQDVDSYRPVPGPTPEEIEAWTAAVEQAEAEKAAAERAAAEEAAAAQAAAAAPAGSVQEIIARYFGAQTNKAIAVARCESGLNPNAMSPGGGNHGLFQINNVHSGHFQSVTGYPWSSRYDAEANTRFAHWLWSQQGWGPWACA